MAGPEVRTSKPQLFDIVGSGEALARRPSVIPAIPGIIIA
jgi:hypothetical protein